MGNRLGAFVSRICTDMYRMALGALVNMTSRPDEWTVSMMGDEGSGYA